jgi:hypothetical protein
MHGWLPAADVQDERGRRISLGRSYSAAPRKGAACPQGALGRGRATRDAGSLNFVLRRLVYSWGQEHRIPRAWPVLAY